MNPAVNCAVKADRAIRCPICQRGRLLNAADHTDLPPFCDCKHPDCRYRRHLTECGQKRYLFQICNQNLWLADCMHRENGLKPILPDACTVIVDEAHKLPETAREMFGTTLTAGEIRSAVVRLKQDGYALAADRLFSASSMLLQKMAELSPEYPVELLHDDLSRVLSTLFLIGRKLSTFLEPATKRALEQLTDKVVLFLRPKTDAIRYTAEDDDGKLMLCSVPADITSRMQHTVWSKQIPLLLTSGTLAIGSSFRRFQDECGLSGNPSNRYFYDLYGVYQNADAATAGGIKKAPAQVSTRASTGIVGTCPSCKQYSLQGTYVSTTHTSRGHPLFSVLFWHVCTGEGFFILYQRRR